MIKITKEEIIKIAQLSKLKFTDKEILQFENEFNNILEYISMIKECDTSTIRFEHNMQDYRGKVLQEDIIKTSIKRDKALQNASEGRTKYGYIRTSKIVSKE